MLWKHLAAAAGLAAATTNAFIVVPDFTEADVDIVKALPLHEADAAAIGSDKTLELDCPGCPVKLRHHAGGSVTKTDVASHLELTFSIDSSTGSDRLLVNDFELYPNTGSWYTSLRAPHVLDLAVPAKKHPKKKSKHHSHHELPPRTPQLGYTLGIRPVAVESEAQQYRLIEIDLQVLEVGYSFVEGIPAVQLKLIEAPTGQLMLGSLDKIAPEESPADADGKGKHAHGHAGDDDEDECASVFCSWRNSIVKGLKSLRPSCAHRKTSAHHHKHMPGQYKHHHTWARLLKNITWSIFLPILIGLVAGVSVAVLGMAVGTLAVCLWRAAFRRHTPWMRRQCRHHAAAARRHKAAASSRAAEETALADEKAGLMENQDEDVADLPPYEEEKETDVATTTTTTQS